MIHAQMSETTTKILWFVMTPIILYTAWISSAFLTVWMLMLLIAGIITSMVV